MVTGNTALLALLGTWQLQQVGKVAVFSVENCGAGKWTSAL